MTELNFPQVNEPVVGAIREAVDYILDRFDDIIAIIIAGSIIRGEGDRYSDVDTFVIIKGDYRQRVQKFFNGVRFELFINSVEFIPLYFEEEAHDGGASTANMLVTGHIVYKTSEIIDDLIRQAQTAIDAGPYYTDSFLTNTRYMLADRFENGIDLRQRDPVMGMVIIDSTISDMLVYQFQKQGHWIPRHKDILKVLRIKEPQLAQLIEQYYHLQGDARYDIAGQIADYTIEARGFFEWESDKDYLD